MSLDQYIYGSTDRPLPSPSSTPKSVADATDIVATPKVQVSTSHFLDPWSTPQVNGRRTPAHTPTLATPTPVDRSSRPGNRHNFTPEDPAFHVNHLVPSTLPLPPVDPSRRLSSSPGPLSLNKAKAEHSRKPWSSPSGVAMDTSRMPQMQTPPPTRDATSRRTPHHNSGNEASTPATVIARTPGQIPGGDGTYNQTPFGFPSLQFSPDLAQFGNAGPMSAPALPQSRLFWDQQPSDGMNMDMAITESFGSASHNVGDTLPWQAFGSTPSQVNPQAFQALHGLSPPTHNASFTMNDHGRTETKSNSRPSSMSSASTSVDPNMLFSFSSPGPAASFGSHIPQSKASYEVRRQPYETQAQDFLREKEFSRKAKGVHTRTSTSSSNASFQDIRPGVQRSNTDSGFRRSRPSSMESRSSGPVASQSIPRRSSPLKRQSAGSLMAIPEIRRPRTRLVIDEDGRARTETVVIEDDTAKPDSRRSSRNEIRLQYPGLWNEDDSDSEADEPVLSRNPSFAIPPHRPSKHSRTDSGGVDLPNNSKMTRAMGGFGRPSLDGVRSSSKKTGDAPFRRFSMMDFPSSFANVNETIDQEMPDSPGDALGALKKVVQGRQKRSEQHSHDTLKAHNHRWAQASADFANQVGPHGQSDFYSNTFSASPSNTDPGLTTPSTARSSLSSDGTRCICNASDDGQPMIQCESCNKWLHMRCIGLDSRSLPPVYVCIFCTGQTPIARGGRIRGPLPPFDSPLTHKSVFRR